MDDILVDVVLKREVKKFGKSSHVILPVEYIGQRVEVVIPQRINLQERILTELTPYSSHVLGVYLTGSYARGEQSSDSDMDVLVVMDEKARIKGDFHYMVVTLEEARDSLENDPISLKPMVDEAETILNPLLLEELREMKASTDYSTYLETTESALKIIDGILGLEEEEGNKQLESLPVVYSLFLRLRLLYLIKCLKQNIQYTNKGFLDQIKGLPRERLYKMYNTYRRIRDNKPAGSPDIRIKDARVLYNTAVKWLSEAGDSRKG
jgi:predicted nucleotidyltransferase